MSELYELVFEALAQDNVLGLVSVYNRKQG